ncbi:hypothetical protein AB0K11_14045 [Mycobacterium sp. NPDC050551]|uniref:hypothetical protein n=1 Tax=Mycobacterium sp. NPDC050551 TaxID=3155407 RepID=UPI003420A777
MAGLTRDDIAVLESMARNVGDKLGWELHFQAATDPEFAGLTAGARHVFITEPARIADSNRHSVTKVLDALRLGRCRITLNANGTPGLEPGC